jgi:GntR family transcriptional regulator
MAQSASARQSPVQYYIDRRSLDRSSPVPLHYQVQEQLRRAITSGRLRVGDMLPAEADLAEEAGVARSTVRQAVGDLVRAGLLRHHRGQGTFVTAPPSTLELSQSYSFAHDLEGSDAHEAVRVLTIRATELLPELRGRAGAHGIQQAVEITRLRLAGDEPVALESVVLPGIAADDLEGTDGSDAALYAMLERRFGQIVTHAEETLGLATVDTATAKLLNLPRKGAVLYLERHTSASDRLVELRRSYIRGDRFRFRIALSREHLNRR